MFKFGSSINIFKLFLNIICIMWRMIIIVITEITHTLKTRSMNVGLKL